MLNRYSQELNLLSYDVYHECNPNKPTFFDVQGILNQTFGYGKHAFAISIIDDANIQGVKFKEGSQILFEVLDSDDQLIYSGLSNVVHINGSTFAYFYIQEDKLETYNEISNGKAKLVVVGQLEGNRIPSKYKNSYNIRSQIPFFIRKQQPNNSVILYEDQPTIKVSGSETSFPSELTGLYQDPILSTKPQLYHTHEFDNLNTFSGETKFAEIAYAISSSYRITNNFQILDTFEISSDVEMLTNDIEKSKGNLPIGYFTDDQNVNPRAVHESNAETYWYTSSLSYTHWSGPEIKSFAVSQSFLNLSGEQGVHALVRKTVTDEQYTLKLNRSGSGKYAIITSQNSASINNTDNALMNSNINVKNNSAFDSSLVFEEFNNEEPNNLAGPNIFGDVIPSAQYGTDEKFYKHRFTVPSGSWFGIRLMSNSGSSASFSEISIKQDPPKGTSPVTTYYKNIAPHIDHSFDNIIYRYRIYNPNRESAKIYTQYPVKDHIMSSSIKIIPPWRGLHRKNANIGHRIRTTHDNDGSSRSVSVIAEAAASGGTGFLSPGRMTTGLLAQAASTPGYDYTGSNHLGVFGIRAMGLTGDASPNALKSTYAGYFGGTDGSGDVIFEQKVGIGDFNTLLQEHPSASLHVKGDIIAENYIVSSSVMHLTESFASGSHVFGNTSDDRHVFTGSVHISGNLDGYFNQALTLDEGNVQFTKGNQYIIFNEPGVITYAKNYIGVDNADDLLVYTHNNQRYNLDDATKRHYFSNPVTIGTTNTTTNPGSNVELSVLGVISSSKGIVLGGAISASGTNVELDLDGPITASAISSSGEITTDTLKVSGYNLTVGGNSQIDQNVSQTGDPQFTDVNITNDLNFIGGSKQDIVAGQKIEFTIADNVTDSLKFMSTGNSSMLVLNTLNAQPTITSTANLTVDGHFSGSSTSSGSFANVYVPLGGRVQFHNTTNTYLEANLGDGANEDLDIIAKGRVYIAPTGSTIIKNLNNSSLATFNSTQQALNVNGSGSFTKPVSIGTNNKSGSGKMLTIEGDVSGAGAIYLQHATAPNIEQKRSGLPQIWQTTVDSSARWILREKASDGGTLYSRLTIDDAGDTWLVENGGNVGIGKQNPTKKLEVAGDISGSGILDINSSFSRVYTDDSNNFKIDDILGNTAFIIKNLDDVSAGAGRVGINKSLPTKALEVEGSISASGNLSIEGTGSFARVESAGSVSVGNGGEFYLLNQYGATTMSSDVDGTLKIQAINTSDHGLILSGGQAGGAPAGIVNTYGSHETLKLGETGDDYIVLSGDKTKSNKDLWVVGKVSASGDIILGDYENGAYISGSQGNLELSGSGTANLIISGTAEFENKSTAPSTTTNKVYNSGSVSASVNTPTLHFNNAALGYQMHFSKRFGTQTATDRGYFQPYYHGGGNGYYGNSTSYYLDSYADDIDVTVYRDVKDGQGSVLRTIGYTSGWMVPESGMLKRIVGVTQNYTNSAAYNINFYHCTPNFGAASVTAKRIAQFVSDTSGDSNTSEQILIDNINKPLAVGDMLFFIIRKTEAGSTSTQYVLMNGSFFITSQ